MLPVHTQKLFYIHNFSRHHGLIAGVVGTGKKMILVFWQKNSTMGRLVFFGCGRIPAYSSFNPINSMQPEKPNLLISHSVITSMDKLKSGFWMSIEKLQNQVAASASNKKEKPL